MNVPRESKSLMFNISLSEIAFIFLILILLTSLIRFKDYNNKNQDLREKNKGLQTHIDQSKQLEQLIEKHFEGQSIKSIDDQFTKLIDISKLKSENQILEKKYKELNESISKHIPNHSPSKIDEHFTKLGEIDKLEKENEELKRKYDESKKLLEDQFQGKTPEVLEQIISELSKSQEYKKELDKLQTERNNLEEINDELKEFEKLIVDIPEILKDQKKLIAENQDLKQRVQYFLNKGGFGPPPCFMDSFEKPEFIYQVQLYDTYFEIAPAWPAYRMKEVKAIPNAYFEYSKFLARKEFKRYFRPVFKWSKAQKCTHYVKIMDKTSLDAKKKYKLNLRLVEGYFYKLLL